MKKNDEVFITGSGFKNIIIRNETINGKDLDLITVLVIKNKNARR